MSTEPKLVTMPGVPRTARLLLLQLLELESLGKLQGLVVVSKGEDERWTYDCCDQTTLGDLAVAQLLLSSEALTLLDTLEMDDDA